MSDKPVSPARAPSRLYASVQLVQVRTVHFSNRTWGAFIRSEEERQPSHEFPGFLLPEIVARYLFPQYASLPLTYTKDGNLTEDG